MSRRRWVERKHLWVVAALMVVGGTTCGLASTAFAATGKMGTITISPNTGLTNGESVSVTGSGFTPSAIGNYLECNNDSSEPTVALPSPVSNSVPVGCSAISYSILVTVSSSGTISKSFTIIQGTVGPPCGTSTDVITTCPAKDSAGNSPASDAALYPCPPTAAQQAAGDTCVLNFGDNDSDSAVGNLTFQGEGTTTTTAPATTTTVAKTTATTVATTGTTAASSGSTGASGGSAGSTGASGGSTGSTGTGGGTTTSSLATTGAGPPLWWMLFVGLMLITLSGVLWLVGPRVWRGRLAPQSSRSDR